MPNPHGVSGEGPEICSYSCNLVLLSPKQQLEIDSVQPTQRRTVSNVTLLHWRPLNSKPSFSFEKRLKIIIILSLTFPENEHFSVIQRNWSYISHMVRKMYPITFWDPYQLKGFLYQTRVISYYTTKSSLSTVGEFGKRLKFVLQRNTMRCMLWQFESSCEIITRLSFLMISYTGTWHGTKVRSFRQSVQQINEIS